jgi:hypothetical protein
VDVTRLVKESTALSLQDLKIYQSAPTAFAGKNSAVKPFSRIINREAEWRRGTPISHRQAYKTKAK